MQLSFGQEVRRLREENGISQAALAEALGVWQTFISKIEKDSNIPGADVLFNLCDALQVPCDHFRPFLKPTSPVTQPEKKRKPGRPKKPSV